MQRDYKVYLQDIRDAIVRIETYTKGFSLEKFLADTLVQDAVLRNFMVIGEAVKSLPEEITQKSDKIEWKEIAGLRIFLFISTLEWTLKPCGTLLKVNYQN